MKFKMLIVVIVLMVSSSVLEQAAAGEPAEIVYTTVAGVDSVGVQHINNHASDVYRLIFPKGAVSNVVYSKRRFGAAWSITVVLPGGRRVARYIDEVLVFKRNNKRQRVYITEIVY